MNSESRTDRLRAFWDMLTIIVFLGLISLPTVDYFFKLDHAEPPQENRLPARWPLFKGLGQSRDFIAGVENFFNDHFGFRKRLVRLNNHWKGQLFHDSGNNRGVLVGRDGWLFLQGERMIAQCTRTDVFSEQELENWRRLLEMRRNWLRARGAKYLFVVPPDKHTVYSEYLPDWLERGTGQSKVQQLVNYMKARSTVEVLDLCHALIEAKKTHVAYLKTDTHWNPFGGFVAYRAVMEALARQMPSLEPLPMEALDWKPGPNPNEGDLARLMGATDSYWETEWLDRVVLKPMARLKEVYDPVRLPQSGLKATWPFFTLNTNASGKAIIVRDSFACSWYLYLGQHFREVIYLWKYEKDQPHYEWDRPLIAREKPDVLIDEMLERFFCTEDPLALAHRDELSETNSGIVSAGVAARDSR
jgi:alginate O-acetyltransferase complex protein AlgJ